MCCFGFVEISICFVLFLNKVKQKIPNEKILRTAINLSICRCSGGCTRNMCGIPRVKNWFQTFYDVRA